MPKLVVTLPTRGRPEKLLHTLSINCQAFTLENTTIFVGVDDDDRATIDALDKAALDPRIVVDIAPREDTVGAKFNRCLKIPADAYYAAADRDPTTTKDADSEIFRALAMFPDGIGWAFGHLVNTTMCSALAVSARAIEALGYFNPEFFPYWFVDHWITEIAYMVDRFVFCDVVTQQDRLGQTQELRDVTWWSTWFDAAHGMRIRDAMRIINYPGFGTSLAQRKILVNNLPLSYDRGFWHNRILRDNEKILHDHHGARPPDERYLRVKKRASELVPHLLYDFNMDEWVAKFYHEQLLGDPAAAPRALTGN